MFSEKLGKISAVAKGAKRNKSKFLSLSLGFCYAEYVVYSGKSLYNITEGELIDSFQDFLKDIDSLTYASYFCELIDITLQEGESHRELFKDFITVLYLLKTKAVDYEILARAFEIKVLKATGYGMNLGNCSLCKKKLYKSNYINLQYYGGVCEDCEKVNGMNISFVTYNALRYLNNAPLDKLHRLSITEDTKKELYKILSLIIANNYTKRPRSLEIFDYFKGSDINE